jgi:hypothetical protein
VRLQPSARPAPTGIITPSRPELSSVPPGTHETWPAMSRLRRNRRRRALVEEAERGQRGVVADARVAVLDRVVDRS